MGSLSSFYGFQKLGPGDQIKLNDYALTSRNVDTIDRLLHKLESAVFDSAAPIDDPTDPLTLEVSTTGGVIPAGRTVRYKFTWVDEYGNETSASPESTITTPSPVQRPSQPSLSYATTGGSLAGTYFYILSAYVGVSTSETNGSVAGSILVPLGSVVNSVTLTLPTLPSGADGFNVFRRGPGETQFYYLDSIDMNVATPPTSYLDDNSVTVNNSRTPTATNLTNSTNVITVTVPGATPTVPEGYTWKVYRTFVASNYESSLLEWVISETDGLIDPSTVDYGAITTTGMPPTVTQVTGNIDLVASLSAIVDDLVDELGTNPSGSYGTVAERLDDLANIHATVEYINSTNDTSSVVDEIPVLWGDATLDYGSSQWAFEGVIFYTADSAEDFKIMLSTLTDEATPVSSGTLLYTIVNDGTKITSSWDGEVFAEEVEVALSGEGYGTVKAAVIKGVYIPSFVLSSNRVAVYYANNSSVATPSGAYIVAGSHLIFTRMIAD